jgi:hypothetical protein
MDWASWSTSLDRFLHSPNLPIWAAVAVAAFFALLVLIMLLRAEKSVANGALAVITLAAITLAGFSAFRGQIFAPGGGAALVTAQASEPTAKAMPALACIDDLAGDMVLAACEKALFSSPEAVAAAVSYASARLTRLTSLGDAAAAEKRMTPDLARLRRSIERDRYGLIAYVLAAQDHCQANDCPAYRSLTDHSRIAANMDEHVYENAVTRYAPNWGMPSTAAAAPPAIGLAAGTPALAGVTEAPSGKPTDIDYPTAASIPPVNIMTPEPAVAAPKPAPTVVVAPPATAHSPKPPHSAAHAAPPAAAPAAKKPPMAAQASAKKPPAPPKPKPAAPVQLAPEAATSDN